MPKYPLMYPQEHHGKDEVDGSSPSSGFDMTTFLGRCLFLFKFSNEFSNDFFSWFANKKIHQIDCLILHEFVSLHVDK